MGDITYGYDFAKDVELKQVRKKIIIGKNGNISIELQKSFPLALVIPGMEYKYWDDSNQLKKMFAGEPYDIYAAIGIVSSKAEPTNLERVNFHIPQKIADIIKGTDSRIITFGSIMEKDEKIVRSNAYIGTKKKLSEYLKENLQEKNFLHVRLHTLYGGQNLNPEMFLGQLFHAIKHKTEFQMSSGNQFREYHHIVDDLRALSLLDEENYLGIQEISHEEVFTLRELAEKALYHFDLLDLLIIGKREDPLNEILTPLGKRIKLLENFKFRPSIAGINSYLEDCLGKKSEGE